MSHVAGHVCGRLAPPVPPLPVVPLTPPLPVVPPVSPPVPAVPGSGVSEPAPQPATATAPRLTSNASWSARMNHLPLQSPPRLSLSLAMLAPSLQPAFPSPGATTPSQNRRSAERAAPGPRHSRQGSRPSCSLADEPPPPVRRCLRPAYGTAEGRAARR